MLMTARIDPDAMKRTCLTRPQCRQASGIFWRMSVIIVLRGSPMLVVG